MGYTQDIEVKMRRHFSRLLENARRGYAAVEAAKPGHGGIEYVAVLFSIDPKTVRRGLAAGGRDQCGTPHLDSGLFLVFDITKYQN